MIVLDLEYLGKLVNRFNGYNSPTDTQKLLVMLAEKTNRDSRDDKKLATLINAEKKAERLFKSRNAEIQVVEKIKATERKARTRNGVIWGFGLKAGATDNKAVADTMIWLFENGYISERDKEVVRADIEQLKKKTD